MNELLLIVLAYLIGSIPTSVWVSKYFFDIDIRDYGSGNAGATNTYRILGPKWGNDCNGDRHDQRDRGCETCIAATCLCR